ncbi:MAG: FliI/YscN family ATPase [Nitratireductor sp.]
MNAAAQAIRVNMARAASYMRSGLNGIDLETELGCVLRVSEGRIVVRLKGAFIGEICHLLDRQGGRRVNAQVVSVEGDTAILSPFEPIGGLSVSTEVTGTGDGLKIRAGEWLVGRVVDALCRPLDNMPIPPGGRLRSVVTQGTAPLDRGVIDRVFPTGIKAIDLFNSVGEGQRMAVFGSPGSGKSTLMSMLASHSDADIVVIAMIGERGREVREFLERQIPAEVRSKSVVVASTSDRPAMERVIAAHSAMTIAEDFRAQGKKVLLLFDSVTRFARALRDVGLAAGEQAVRNGLTASFYSELPKLIERAGNSDKGSITAFFTVLYENEGVNDAIADEVTSLTDGHIILDTALAASGHYPAINILKSKSRLMREIAPREVVRNAAFFRDMLAKYQEIELLVQVGEYKPGSDPECDRAIRARPLIQTLSRQEVEERVDLDHATYLAGRAADALRSKED